MLDAGEVDGKFYGVPISMNVKSLVFYPKPAFEAKGYPVPKTQQELADLTNKIKADGTTPWCMGMESAAATGWVATDWIEANLLESRPARRPTTSGSTTRSRSTTRRSRRPRSRSRASRWPTATCFGGRKQTVSTAFATSANPMFDNPPRCFLHRQGNFITQAGFFPANIVADIDNQVGVFQYPGKTAEDKPMLGGGDLAAVFNGKDDDTKQVMAFLTGPDYQGWSETAGFLSPRKDYAADQLQVQADPADRAARAASPPSSGSTAPTRCRARSAPAASGRAWSRGSAARRTWTPRSRRSRSSWPS